MLLVKVISTEAVRTIDGHPAVRITLDQVSKTKFGRLTVNNVGRFFEFRTAEKVLMKARIMTPMLGGDLQLVGEFSDDEAFALARRIASEELVVEVRLVNDR